VHPLQKEFLSRMGAVEEELAKRGVELERATDFLAQRIEFVRRETLFELKYGEPPEGSTERDQEPRILNPEKVGEMAVDGFRLNVGCGHIPLDGYVNVDRRELPSVDVVAEADHMPFEEESARELFSAHLIEHFTKEQFRRTVLPYWKALLRPGGILRAVAPDGEAMIVAYRNGEIAFEDYREVTYGAQDYDSDFHFNMFSQKSLTELLEEAGFVDVCFPATARRNGKCFELEVEARRPDTREHFDGGRATRGRRLQMSTP
jgi:predicted SAM-dependent methyltransferase